ncbi:MAG: hypothetical protein RLZZ528_2814 [Pseudomonadota bacterium]
MSRPLFGLILCALALAGCQPAVPACTSPAERQLAIVDRLIAETESIIARGYTVEDANPAVTLCVGGRGEGAAVNLCTNGKRRAPVDMAEEQRKLDGLIDRRAALLAQIEADRAACTGAAP